MPDNETEHAFDYLSTLPVPLLEYQRGKTAQQRTWQSATQANKPWQKRQQIAVINCLVLAQLP